MSNMLRRCSLAVAGCLLIAAPLMADKDIKGNLVTTGWLEKHLNNTDLVILDASPMQAYKASHIPGAVSVDIFAWYGGRESRPAETERLYQSWGISPGKTVVMYDQGGSMMATRVLFSLYSHGFAAQKLLILDGGLFQWQQKGLPVTKDPTPVPKQGTFKIEQPNQDAEAKLPEFLTASGDPGNNVLLEALDADWHFGEVLAFNRAGHIPHGILLPTTDLYNPDRTFKSPEEISKILTYLGIRPEQRIYTYCGGGVAASVPFFALKFMLNYPKVKLYAGSELEWLSDERDLPYWTYDAPFLMRDANWLQFGTAQMPRMVGVTRVSIIDVRPAGAFAQGHVPFALNIPAEVFKNNLADPGRLAEILGAAGVDASDEAVVISGAGLTKDSALAFLMLEKLGQKRVSLFMDSLEKWGQLGFALSKQQTVVSPKKSRQDLAIPPTKYPANFRSGVIIGDAKSTHGLYPKVFLASGQNVPATTQDGNVVHVPYTDLLNPDGTVKPAKDIWNILTKAGAPRYAELVCFSENPGEAAVNYFILKLMGYPDIKVLVM